MSFEEIERFMQLCTQNGVESGKLIGDNCIELKFFPRVPTVEKPKKDDKVKPDKRPDGMAAALTVGDE